MPIKQRRFAKLILASGALLLGGAVSLAALPPSAESEGARSLEASFRAAYPMTAAEPGKGAMQAGVRLPQLTGALEARGLRLSARDNHPVGEGGIILSFSDRAGEVRAVLRIGVAPSSAEARRYVDTHLMGVSRQLPAARDGSLGDVAFADEGTGGSLVIAAVANIGYVVSMIVDGNEPAGLPSAAAIAGLIRTHMVAGSPTYPTATLSLPQEVGAEAGGDVRAEARSGSLQLRAEGGYVARGERGPVIRPHGTGPVTLVGTVVDDLGRVTVVRAHTMAR